MSKGSNNSEVGLGEEQMEEETRKLSPQVLLDLSEEIFLVKENGIELCLCESEFNAMSIVDSLAHQTQQRLQEEGMGSPVYRQDFPEKNTTVISAERDGWFFKGYVTEEVVYEYIGIHSACLLKPRLSSSEARVV